MGDAQTSHGRERRSRFPHVTHPVVVPQLRLCLEVLWPLFLFLILMWVRTRGLKETRPECEYLRLDLASLCWSGAGPHACMLAGHYMEKAMPSAGQFAFLHSLVCNAPNVCHTNNGSIAPPFDGGTRPK